MQPFWSNYHSHTRFCDGVDSPLTYLQMAVEKGVMSYGFSSHAPLPFQHNCKWVMKNEALKKYLQEIEEAKCLIDQEIQAYRSLEIDYVPGKFGPGHESLKDFALDYTLGSIHFVDQFHSGALWEIDGPHQVFRDGLEQIFDNDIKEVVTRYYELTREMLEYDPPDILGHLDKIKIQNYRSFTDSSPLFSEKDDWYQDQVMKTLEIVKEKEVIVEVNTRGIYQKKSLETYPGPGILKIIKALEIPVTVSSDCHHPQQITSEFVNTVELLISLGFSKVKILWGHQWVDARLTEKGYLID